MKVAPSHENDFSLSIVKHAAFDSGILMYKASSRYLQIFIFQRASQYLLPFYVDMYSFLFLPFFAKWKHDEVDTILPHLQSSKVAFFN